MSNNTQDSSVIKLLVDAVSDKLQNLSEKINVYIPILNQISKTTDNGLAEINKILFETQSLTKTLSGTLSDFYDRTDSILRKTESMLEKVNSMNETIRNAEITDAHEDIKDGIYEVVNTLDSSKIKTIHSDIMKELSEIKTLAIQSNNSVEPISKFSKMVSKPVGLLVFVISLIIASYTITNCVSKFVEYVGDSHKNMQSSER